jgi:flagellar assembly protein FliH
MAKIAAAFEGAARVPVWTRPSATGFTARAAEQGGFSAWAQDDGTPNSGFRAGASNDVADAETLVAQGYAEGLNEGRRLAMIAALLATTVKRLVTQIVGETEINSDTLAERTQAMAVMIAEETAPKRLRLHPTDVARLAGVNLAIDVVGDPMLAPGTIMLDTGSGWVEDGPHVRLEKLRAQLDRLGAPQ